MSALRLDKPPRPRSRLRKVWCSDCGYTVQMARSWIAVGLPACPNPDCHAHGQPMACADIGDAIKTGHATLDDLPRTIRTQVCRANGWEDSIIRTSPAQVPGYRKGVKRPKKPEMPF